MITTMYYKHINITKRYKQSSCRFCELLIYYITPKLHALQDHTGHKQLHLSLILTENVLHELLLFLNLNIMKVRNYGSIHVYP